jgi:hypothetical protein
MRLKVQTVQQKLQTVQPKLALPAKLAPGKFGLRKGSKKSPSFLALFWLIFECARENILFHNNRK